MGTGDGERSVQANDVGLQHRIESHQVLQRARWQKRVVAAAVDAQCPQAAVQASADIAATDNAQGFKSGSRAQRQATT